MLASSSGVQEIAFPPIPDPFPHSATGRFREKIVFLVAQREREIASDGVSLTFKRGSNSLLHRIIHRTELAQGFLLSLGQTPDAGDVHALIGTVTANRLEMFAGL